MTQYYIELTPVLKRYFLSKLMYKNIDTIHELIRSEPYFYHYHHYSRIDFGDGSSVNINPELYPAHQYNHAVTFIKALKAKGVYYDDN